LEQKKGPKMDSLTACVAHVLGVDASEVPGNGGVRLNQWLAARNLGLVPVEAPQSFKWPGRFLGLRSGSSTWAVFFGVPPGGVYDPVAETHGRPPEGSPEGADIALEAAFVVAKHDLLQGIGPGRRSPGRRSESTGTVEVIALAAEAESPMTVVPSVEAVENRGLVGDRYERKEGTFSDPNGRGYDLTLVEAEALEELAAKGVELSPAEARRNLVVRGVALDALIGKRFRVGEVECFGQRRCEPCAHLERLTKPGVLRGLVHRGGLRADVLLGGEIHTGDSVEALL
jgi:MOSC domain-containing protein YiiM